MNPNSAEIAYLKRLIKDFPAEYRTTEAAKAYNDIAARFQFFERNVDLLAAIPKTNDVHQVINKFLLKLSYDVHAFLFDGILSNAGKIRSSSDPGNGHIHFGGQKHQQQRTHFQGTPPARIKQELNSAFSHLHANSNVPVQQDLRFYQRFVKIYPFYDANGRIGRLIVSVYLYSFDHYVLWSKFDGG